MKSLKVVFFGTPKFVVPVLEKVYQNYQLLGVVTNPDKPIGRHQQIVSSPVKAAFLRLNPDPKKVLIPKKIHSKHADREFFRELTQLAPDLFIVASYANLIPQAILDIPKYGALNIHPSLLPKYRGVSPMVAAILNGDQVSGVTIYQMDAQMDHGPIVAQEEFMLSENDTYESLSNNMFRLGAQMLEKIVPDYINNRLQLTPQDDSKASYAKFISKQDGFFEIDNPPDLVILDRMIRAFHPWPNVWTNWQGKIVKLLPGNLIQVEGKKAMPLKVFYNGYPEFPLKELANRPNA